MNVIEPTVCNYIKHYKTPPGFLSFFSGGDSLVRHLQGHGCKARTTAAGEERRGEDLEGVWPGVMKNPLVP